MKKVFPKKNKVSWNEMQKHKPLFAYMSKEEQDDENRRVERVKNSGDGRKDVKDDQIGGSVYKHE